MGCEPREWTIQTVTAGVMRVCLHDPDQLEKVISLALQCVWSLGVVDICDRLHDRIPIASLRSVFIMARGEFASAADDYGSQLFAALPREALL